MDRIVTRCPACGNQTLFVGEGGHLTCSWLECPAPGVERFLEERGVIAQSPTQRAALLEVLGERLAQDAVWRGRSKPVEHQYAYAAPHVLLLEEQVGKLRENWYGTADETSLRGRFIKMAAIALRALEEIKITR